MLGKPVPVVAYFYIAHYLYRSLVFPFAVAHSMKPQSIVVALCAFFFNALNGFNNAQGLAALQSTEWQLQQYVGALLFLAGLFINYTSDLHLASLRANRDDKRSEKAAQEYFIPHAGFFQLVSCANYWGEIGNRGLANPSGMVRLGSLGQHHRRLGLFALHHGYAVATDLGNLVPRALSTHAWYQKKFPDYPKSRKAVFPYVL
ncbi:3-oxo-5-alpha-steroid 4-dehydrogenase 1 [Kappamyces sp. JEL0829]|nr:3-oxo-5-alpha-steroid 4-dehydrogenase 1 [Kappamyces sp. JEL0829]